VCTARKMDWKKAAIYANIFLISAVELTAIQMTMQLISGQEAEGNLILTDGMLDAPKGTGR
jgi:hypothetical protein